MAAMAKKGNPQILFPVGCNTVEELPWDLSLAISHAFAILSWYENRPSDKIPPRYMWPHDEELEKFFKRVDDVDNQSSSDDDDDEGAIHNEYAERFR